MPENTARSVRSASSPSSVTPGNVAQSADGSNTKAAKDKNCPFCQQAFTSSSLGRHLDLYIRPDNPKPPDGVHDVEKIKLVRSGITRRQPRTSLKAKQERDGASEHSATGTPAAAAAVPAAVPAPRWTSRPSTATAETSTTVPVDRGRLFDNRDGDMLSPGTFSGNYDVLRPHDMIKTRFNTANWQATGVINDIPPPVKPTATSSTTSRTPRDAPEQYGDGVDTADPEALARVAEDKEAGKAAQMALREVLNSLEAARERDSIAPLFDFDFYSLPFPALCLEILLAPPTLFSSSPFPDPDTWSIQQPTQDQYEALQHTLQKRIQQHHTPVPDAEIRKLYDHLETAFEVYNSHSPTSRNETTHLETLRALAKTQERSRAQTYNLDLARQEIAHLRQQRDFLSRCQLPRPMLLNPPDTLPISPALHASLATITPESRSWSYDRLMSKWRGSVRAAAPTGSRAQTQTQTGVAASRALSVATPPGSGSGSGPNRGVQVGTSASAAAAQYNPYRIWSKSAAANGGEHVAAGTGAEAKAKATNGNGHSAHWLFDESRRYADSRLEGVDRRADVSRPGTYSSARREVDGGDDEDHGDGDGLADGDEDQDRDQEMVDGDHEARGRPGSKRSTESFPGSAGTSLKRKPPPLGAGGGQGRAAKGAKIRG